MSTPTDSSRLTADDEIRLAKQIEAGVLAAALLEAGDHGVPSWGSVCSAVAPSSAADPPEPAELRALVRQGEQAKEALALANLGLVRVISADLARRSWANRADLFQEGCVALEQAIRRYDFHRGRFGVFAGRWIRGHLHDVAYPARREIAVGAELGLDQPVEPVDDVHNALNQGVDHLPEPERRVVRLRHGWGTGQPATLRQVAARLQVSVTKVRRLERRGLDLLRQDWLAMAT